MMACVVATAQEAKSFYGINCEGDTVHFCGTATVIAVEETETHVDVTLAGEYCTVKNDTVVEHIPKWDKDFFLLYLKEGDKVDFCIGHRELIVRRVRLQGGVDNYFIDAGSPKGEAKVLRIGEGGVLVLENGVVILEPKQLHQVGDKVSYKEKRFSVMMAKEK